MTQTGDTNAGAGYPTSNPWLALFGANSTQGNVPARSNAEWLSLSGAVATNTLVASGVGACVAIPMVPGTPISKVTIWVTATAASTPTHQFAAIYAGTGAAPALLGQTADATTAAVAANAPYSLSFSSPITPTQAQCPNGFVYVMISMTGSTNPTIVTVTGPTVGAYGTMVPASTAPLFFAATSGSALAGTAPATIASPSTTTAVPLVIVS